MMKRNYDDYDFETFYADVNDFSYDRYTTFFQSVETCYDTYTGSSDDMVFYRYRKEIIYKIWRHDDRGGCHNDTSAR